MPSQQSDTCSTKSDKCLLIGSRGQRVLLKAYGLVEVKAKESTCGSEGMNQEFPVGENHQARVPEAVRTRYCLRSSSSGENSNSEQAAGPRGRSVGFSKQARVESTEPGSLSCSLCSEGTFFPPQVFSSDWRWRQLLGTALQCKGNWLLVDWPS